VTTAVDTNILLDVLIPGAPHAQESETALTEALRQGSVILSEPVFAELAAHFDEQRSLHRFLIETSLSLRASGTQALFRAGREWKEYLRRRPTMLTCPQCGTRTNVSCDRCGATIQSRQHLVADFIIGAHALEHAGLLLTRDRGFYATYFPGLTLG
jgi:predicted nucleic acid-binding protein